MNKLLKQNKKKVLRQLKGDKANLDLVIHPQCIVASFGVLPTRTKKKKK